MKTYQIKAETAATALRGPICPKRRKRQSSAICKRNERMKPTVKLKCVANNYAAPNERIVEVFDNKTKHGCLISIRVSDDGMLIVEPYRGGGGTLVRVNGQDHRIPA